MRYIQHIAETHNLL